MVPTKRCRGLQPFATGRQSTGTTENEPYVYGVAVAKYLLVLRRSVLPMLNNFMILFIKLFVCYRKQYFIAKTTDIVHKIVHT